MKKIILATLAAAALVACAKEDVVVAPKGEAIAFNNAFVDGTTKAIDPSVTTETLMGFKVYGTTKGDHDGAKVVNIFNGVDVLNGNYTGNYTGDNWKYAATCTQYWIDGNTYNFAAVVNGDVTTDENGMPKTIAYNATTQADLLYDAVDPIEGKKTGNEAVAFTFAHLLSKAVFSFKNTTAEEPNTGYFYTVKDIQVSGIGQTATYTVGAVTPWGTPATYYAVDAPLTFGNIVETVAASVAGTAATQVDEQETWFSNYERLLIPGTYNVTVKCTISLYLNEENDDHLVDLINYTTTLNNYTFNPGHAYCFKLEAGLTDPIKFTVTPVDSWITNWTEVNEDLTAPEHDNTPNN